VNHIHLEQLMAEDPPLLEAETISKEYRLGKSTVVHALRGVSLTLRRGAFTVISGPSGSGKSTLLHLLSCLDKASSGRLRITGQDVEALSDHALSCFRARQEQRLASLARCKPFRPTIDRGGNGD
jgi:ABC-type lipoprotein export system ATPase subunit